MVPKAKRSNRRQKINPDNRRGFSFAFFTALLSALPLWQASFEFCSPIIAKKLKAEALPRLDMYKIPEEEAVLSVITALATSTKEIEELVKKLSARAEDK